MVCVEQGKPRANLKSSSSNARRTEDIPSDKVHPHDVRTPVLNAFKAFCRLKASPNDKIGLVQLGLLKSSLGSDLMHACGRKQRRVAAWKQMARPAHSPPQQTSLSRRSEMLAACPYCTPLHPHQSGSYAQSSPWRGPRSMCASALAHTLLSVNNILFTPLDVLAQI